MYKVLQPIDLHVTVVPQLMTYVCMDIRHKLISVSARKVYTGGYVGLLVI